MNCVSVNLEGSVTTRYMGVRKIYNYGSFQPRSSEQTANKETKRHAVLNKTSSGWEVEKSLNVQDSLMSKVSRIPEENREPSRSLSTELTCTNIVVHANSKK